MTDLEAAWNAVHEDTPPGRYVGRAGYEERDDQWSKYVFDPDEGPSFSGTLCWRPSCPG